MSSTFLNSKATLSLIRSFISEEEEQILLDKYGIEFVSYDEYETLEDLLKSWKDGITRLGVKFANREDDPVFDPLKKYYNTFLRDLLLQIKKPEIAENMIILDEKHWFESRIIPEAIDKVRESFFVDYENPYLYNFTEGKTSENISRYMDDIAKRRKIFESSEKDFSGKEVKAIFEKSKLQCREEKVDKYFSFDIGLWIKKADEILSVVCNPYINAHYTESKTPMDPDFKKFAESLCT